MQLNRNKQSLTIEGETYTREELLCRAAKPLEDSSAFYGDLYRFLAEWFNDSSTLTVQTSGSTGNPKPLEVSKEKMMQSARLTCETLHLNQADAVLLCMPLQYIAGKMMVVRALVAGLNLFLRTPSGHPLADLDIPIRFAAMIPLQVYNTLQVSCEKERLSHIGIIIIGGGPIDAALEQEIRLLPCEAYSTYGMTETLSHIALRRLNGSLASSRYRPFSSVELSLSPEGTLIVYAPLVCNEVLVTNDIVELDADGSFVVLGRKDNIINSGGIKIQSELVEESLKRLITRPFAITAVSDSRLGQALVLLIEEGKDMDGLRKEINKKLPKFQQPRYFLTVARLPTTGSGKIDRAGCRLLAEKLIQA